jgi:hypothetical protein
MSGTQYGEWRYCFVAQRNFEKPSTSDVLGSRLIRGLRGERYPFGWPEDKGCVGRLPQALIKGPKAFPVQPFLRFSGKLAITNDVGHALDVVIVYLMCHHCQLPFDRLLSDQYRASGRVPLGVFLQTRHSRALKDPQGLCYPSRSPIA